MRKALIYIMLLVANVTYTFAGNCEIKWGGVEVSLSVSYEDDSRSDRPVGRTQMRRPVVHIEDNELTVPDQLMGSLLQIVSEGEVIYSGYVTSNVISLPTDLLNTYTIMFYIDNYCFWAEIESV